MKFGSIMHSLCTFSAIGNSTFSVVYTISKTLCKIMHYDGTNNGTLGYRVYCCESDMSICLNICWRMIVNDK